jgi:hypothetical protein
MGTENLKKLDLEKDPSPGRVTVDDRGRNVWQWTGDVDSTTSLLKSLDTDALALEKTNEFARPDLDFRPDDKGRSGAVSKHKPAKTEVTQTRKSVAPGSGSKPGGGFNPYDNS